MCAVPTGRPHHSPRNQSNYCYHKGWSHTCHNMMPQGHARRPTILGARAVACAACGVRPSTCPPRAYGCAPRRTCGAVLSTSCLWSPAVNGRALILVGQRLACVAYCKATRQLHHVALWSPTGCRVLPLCGSAGRPIGPIATHDCAVCHSTTHRRLPTHGAARRRLQPQPSA